MLLLILGLVGFIVGMVNYFVPPIEHPITASPLDTRLLPFSPSDCGDLTVELLDPSNSSQIQVDLYLLSRKPDTDLGAIIHELGYFDLNSYQTTELYYHYYLVSRSSIQIKIAFDDKEAIKDGISLILYVSQSNEEYHCYFTGQVLDCTMTINIEKDSLYDVTLKFSGTSPAVVGRIEIIINKYIYEIERTITIKHCSAPCSREINRYNEHALVTTSNVTETVTWSDKVGYKWTCSNMRSVGMWVDLVMLLGMLVMMVSIGFIVGLSVVLCIKKRTQDDETEPLISQNSSPLPNLVEPPPQYTVSASNPLLSLSNPPPYTESTDQQEEGATPK